MANQDKKVNKLQERLAELETELLVSLTKKSSNTVEVDVSGHTRKIEAIRKQLKELK